MDMPNNKFIFRRTEAYEMRKEISRAGMGLEAYIHKNIYLYPHKRKGFELPEEKSFILEVLKA